MPADSGALVAARDALDGLETILRSHVLAGSPTRESDLRVLETTREQLGRRYTLAVVGEFSSGKSYLLNALLGKVRFDERGEITGLLATDINPSTATITELEYGSPEYAYAKYASGRTERIALEGLSRFVAVGRQDERGALHDATGDEENTPTFVVVAVASPFLRSGFVVADTPGLASPNIAHRRATLSYLPHADAVLYLIDTQQPFTEGDAAFLGLIAEHVRTIFIVQTKIDLWRSVKSGERPTWEAARERIVARAARLAPEAVVFSVSAHEYALGGLTGDAPLADRSGFPALLAGLEHSLETRAQADRTHRTLSIVRQIAGPTSARVRNASELACLESAALSLQRTRAEEHLVERERLLADERDAALHAGRARERSVTELGIALRHDASRALARMIDVADIQHVADRARLGVLVDATLAPVWSAFAADVAAAVAGELTELEGRRPQVRVLDLVALRLGGEPGTGAWSREFERALTSTIVLRAVGGPALSFVDAVTRGFAGRRYGTYMKRELGADLIRSILPALEADIVAFVDDIAARLGGAYDDAAASIERERSRARAEALGPIDRAQTVVHDVQARNALASALAVVAQRLDALDGCLTTFEDPQPAPQAGAANDAGRTASLAFDSDAYDRALRPERYRVVLLGALRRGKSSLINAIAGSRLLRDDAAREVLYPVHVRYGAAQRAFGLETDGRWHEIATDQAMDSAARAPVLIEVPWAMPRELVIVHAPAFDSGNEQAEAIALAAARNASEILGLFSRQLSDRELALYERVAHFGKPILLAHTIADNESSTQRRTVVELAARYIRERGIPAGRIFTISAVDYLDGLQNRRRPAPWNEFDALRETLRAHAEEHMQRAYQREQQQHEPVQPPSTTRAAVPNALHKFRELFRRR